MSKPSFSQDSIDNLSNRIIVVSDDIADVSGDSIKSNELEIEPWPILPNDDLLAISDNSWQTGFSVSPNILGSATDGYTGDFNSNGPPMEELLSVLPHRNLFPISVELSVAKRISPIFSVETGLGYNYLHSIFDGPWPGMTTDCRWHYLEVPIKMDISIYNNRWVEIYGSIKTDINIPVYSIAISNRPYEQTENTRVKFHSNPIFSIGGGVGLSIHLSNRLDFYVEPTLKYHFNNNDITPNLWIDQPLGITVPIGFRFKW